MKGGRREVKEVLVHDTELSRLEILPLVLRLALEECKLPSAKMNDVVGSDTPNGGGRRSRFSEKPSPPTIGILRHAFRNSSVKLPARYTDYLLVLSGFSVPLINNGVMGGGQAAISRHHCAAIGSFYSRRFNKAQRH